MDDEIKKWLNMPECFEKWKLEFYHNLFTNPSKTAGYGMIGRVTDDSGNEYRILLHPKGNVACECSEFNGTTPLSQEVKEKGCQHIQFFNYALTAAMNLSEEDAKTFFEEKDGKIFNNVIKICEKDVKQAFKELEQFF